MLWTIFAVLVLLWLVGVLLGHTFGGLLHLLLLAALIALVVRVLGSRSR
jgi:uncharacterized protein DUF5670